MRNKIILFLSISLLFGTFSMISAQGAPKQVAAKGEVVSVEPMKIVLRTDDGPLDLVLNSNTIYKRVSPDKPDVKSAVASVLADIGVGDKLVAAGAFSDDRKTLLARSIYLMTKADITQRQSKDSEQWKTRGISGRVSKIDPQTNQISIEVRGLA
ncbi:MAG: hypothetical protein H7070_05035, partial [Saprospiraceae bacterium]|nr:hypothetical protein [Pyrinomonadaceae bacterium]